MSESNIVYFAKVKDNAKIPSKIEENGGYDIYACFDEDYIVIPPHEVKLIPTGIASSFSNDYVMVLKERGSTGTKNMGQRSGIIDSGFRNEWLVPISNLTDSWMFITKIPKEEIIKQRSSFINGIGVIDKREEYGTFYPYEKAICQALLLPVPKVDVVEITYDELKNIKSERGMGMLGSSNK